MNTKNKNRINKINKWLYTAHLCILISIGILTIAYFLKLFTILIGIPFAINEIIKTWLK